jgi:O-antigen ligase
LYYRPFPSLAFALFALTLALAPASTKLGGLSWLLLCFMGLWAFFQSEQHPNLNGKSEVLSTSFSTSLSLARDQPSPAEEAARIWLFACLAATFLRIIPHAFWQDDWDRRHAEARLVLGALATLALVKLPPFYRLTIKQLCQLGYVLSFACWMGLGVTAVYGRETPVHPIAWAVSLSFLTCLLAPMTLNSRVNLIHRKFWILSVLIGCLGVVLSQSRGVYGLLIWLSVTSFFAASNSTLFKFSNLRMRNWLLILVSFVCLIWILYVQPEWLKAVFQRLSEGWIEASMAQINPKEAANTSIGSRFFLWGKAFDAIELQPWMGYGKENSIAVIKQWGLDINSAQVQKLGHLHHEFLDAWFSHGLMGIISLIVLATGMGLVVRKLWEPHPIAAQGVLGILFMHLSAGLSNTNMVHNYYGAMLSLSISLALVIAASEEADR